jgi:Ca2+-binding RTX toxin-like protein
MILPKLSWAYTCAAEGDDNDNDITIGKKCFYFGYPLFQWVCTTRPASCVITGATRVFEECSGDAPDFYDVYLGDGDDRFCPKGDGLMTCGATYKIGPWYSEWAFGLKVHSGESGDPENSGDSGNDYIIGSINDDQLRSSAGKDKIWGLAGTDSLWTFSSNCDWASGGDGVDGCYDISGYFDDYDSCDIHDGYEGWSTLYCSEGKPPADPPEIWEDWYSS